jgi:hypothetical protein
MSNAIALAPGFSPVNVSPWEENRFNGFPPAGQPLKRLTASPPPNTRLKPGANETKSRVPHLCEAQ